MSVPVRTVQSMERIEVVTAAGAPVGFVRDGRTWRVGAEPVRWFERVDWWSQSPRMKRGGNLKIDVEVWRVQARIGGNPRTPLVTFELVLGQDRAAWSVRSMEAVAA
jgi:hypothetical protein